MLPAALGQRPLLRSTRRPATSPSVRVTRDQVEDYAARMGRALEEVERWLSPNLAYDPETVAAPA